MKCNVKCEKKKKKKSKKSSNNEGNAIPKQTFMKKMGVKRSKGSMKLLSFFVVLEAQKREPISFAMTEFSFYNFSSLLFSTLPTKKRKRESRCTGIFCYRYEPQYAFTFSLLNFLCIGTTNYQFKSHVVFRFDRFKPLYVFLGQKYKTMIVDT